MLHARLTRREAVVSLAATFSTARRLAAYSAQGGTAPGSTALTNETIFFDNSGLIAQRNGDGGDSAQREGMYWLALAVRQRELKEPWPHPRRLRYEEVMSLLEVEKKGEFRRNPVNWSDPKDFSRDQTVPIVAAMGALNDKERLERFYRELRRRNWFAQNHDLMGDPVHRNLVARARDQDPNRFTDAPSLFAAAQARVLVARGSLDDVGDDLNMVVIFTLTSIRKPSNGSNGAREYYSKNRPDNYGMFLQSYRDRFGIDWDGKTSSDEMRRRMDEGIRSGWKPDCPRVLGAIRWYFRAESGGSPGLAAIYEPIVKRWFE